jgi:aryl-alcohol dehydrogenase-like predicted oxidoreductase
VNFFDGADYYGNGRNEELMQKAFHDRWDKVVFATKFGFERTEDGKKFLGINAKPEYVRKCCEKSLKMLGKDTIDLYYLHRVDPHTPIEDSIGAMSELVNEGKVRYIGVSEASAETIKKANDVHPLTAVESEYSICSTDVEETSLPAARELGLAFVAYCPLGRGFLTGKMKSHDDFAPDDYRRKLPRFQKENFNKNLELLKEVEKIAAEKKVKTSQLALAWVLNQGDDIFPIPGTTKINNLLENVEAINIKLTQEETNKLESIMKFISGERYTPEEMKGINL